MLVDVESGQPIRWAIWADLDTGYYEAFRREPNEAVRAGVPLDSIRYRGRAEHLRFIPLAPPTAGKPTTSEDMTEMVKWARKGQPIVMVDCQECDEPHCHRLACWRVSDEQEIAPERTAEGLEERAVTVRVRKYCDRHYRFPTLTSLRGVQREVEVKARPA